MNLESELANGILTSNGHLLGGQPSLKLLNAAKANGFEVLVTLCAEDETPSDERHVVERAGLQYVHLPVTSFEDLDLTFLARFAEIWNGAPAIIHCRSGNRVGAACALMKFSEVKDIDQAILFGNTCGLTRMRDSVREGLK